MMLSNSTTLAVEQNAKAPAQTPPGHVAALHAEWLSAYKQAYLSIDALRRLVTDELRN